MISVTFERERHTNWPVLLQVDVAGDGSATNNIKINTKWMLVKKKWNHDVVLGSLVMQLGSINCSLGGVVFEDNNQQRHNAIID